MTISAEYAVGSKRRRASTLKLCPGVKTTNEKTGSEVRLGEISLERGQERSFEVKFSSSERVLATAHMGSSVRWMLNLPRAEQVIRDFLFGNLYLFGDCALNSNSVRGSILALPSDVLFFDSERRALGKWKSIMMLYELWKRGVRIDNKGGISFEFAASKDADEHGF